MDNGGMPVSLFRERPIRTPYSKVLRNQYNYSGKISIQAYGVSTSIGYGVSSFLSNTTYSSQQINTAYSLLLDTAYRSSDKVLLMTNVIKGKFEKIKDVKVEDVSLTCDTPLEVFNMEEYEADDDMGYDPFDVAFIEWLASKNFNYKTMDHYTMNALWIYWIKGDDEVELTDEESSDDEDEITEFFRIETNIFNYDTPLCSAFNEFNYLLKVDPDLLTKDIIGFKTYEDYKDDWIYEWNKDIPWVYDKPWLDNGVWKEPTPDYEWYEALKYCELKNKALRNKAIMEGFIKDDDDESRSEQMK
ncbi:hypothetical protein Tco_0054202 [Tanacetum coccineum]